MHERENALKEWLSQIFPNTVFSVNLLTGDASFRRYFRIVLQDKTFIAMDAPPAKEDIVPFIKVAKLLSQAGILGPEIIALDQAQGFLLLSDLGDELLLNHLNSSTVHNYYSQAMDLLLRMQTRCANDCEQLPLFDKAFMLKEMALCPEWFFEGYLSLELSSNERSLLDEAMEWLAYELEQQPKVFIHRDYHSRNLMLEDSSKALAVIDFQDAMQGPLAYDLVSLLKDCYVVWPRERVLEWVTYFYNQAPLAKCYSIEAFVRAFDLTGLQRHLKVLGVFSRLYLRDDKAGYLKDLPRVLAYVLECCALYPELRPLFSFFQTRVILP